MKTELLPHNKAAYKKVMQSFKTADKTCVIHPTGTGKSYLIAAVSESYKRVLILAPNIFVLGQVENVTRWHPSVDYMTYAFLNSRGNEKQYDLIVLDEFHRAGATEWGEAVRKLLSESKAKVLGTTATPIRYLDEGRNMAEEIFNGNVASQMSIGEAWHRNILPIPTYVTGLFDFKNTAEEVRERIKAAKRIKDKAERLAKLAQTELDWEHSEGMPAIIRKHIKPDTKRIIVFCNSVRHLHTMKATIAKWFDMAGLEVADIYSVSHDTDSENPEQMQAFEQDTADGVKIMLAVNMLNEGVHIPRVDAVIMLRTTASRIIYMQQLGRCLTAANSKSPVVLDMVDNISGANAITDIKNEFEQLEQGDSEEGERQKKIPRQFHITDYTQGLRQVINKLTEGTARVMTIQQRLDMIEDFIQKHGRLPKGCDKEHYRNWKRLLFYKDQVPRVYELIELYPRWREESQMANDLTEFIKTHERMPTNGDDAYAKYIGKVFKEKRDKWLDTYPQLKEQFETHYRWRDRTQERMQAVVEFVKRNHRMPHYPDKEAAYYLYIRKRGLLDKLKELVEPFLTSGITWKSRLDELKNFVLSEGRLPHRKSDALFNYWKKTLASHRKDPLVVEIKMLVNRTRYDNISLSDEDLADIVMPFCIEHGRLPKKTDEGQAFSAWTALRYKRKSPLADDIFKQYSSASPLNPQNEERINNVVKFFEENGRIPWRKDGDIRDQWTYVRTRCKDDPRVIAIKKASGCHPKP